MKTFQVKLEIYLPEDVVSEVREALHKVGAGRVGNYDHCLAITRVEGYWRPLEGADPYQGEVGEISHSRECKMEIRCPANVVAQAVQAVKEVHPYEEPVINVIPLLSPSA